MVGVGDACSNQFFKQQWVQTIAKVVYDSEEKLETAVM